MSAKRVLAVGLGDRGMSYAMAYNRIEGFEVAGLCRRNVGDLSLPDALRPVLEL